MMGMAIMSVLLSVPAHLTVEHFARTTWRCAVSPGCSASALGLFIVYENGVLNRLFA
jgi:hypothetical protein